MYIYDKFVNASFQYQFNRNILWDIIIKLSQCYNIIIFIISSYVRFHSNMIFIRQVINVYFNTKVYSIRKYDRYCMNY